MERLNGIPRWLVLGAAAAAVITGFALARHPAGIGSGAAAPVQATVPPKLAAGDDPGTLGPSPAPTKLVVYVVGAVQKPGVYALRPGGRVVDAVARAGGARADADLSLLNLAEPLADAMKVAVPRKGELSPDEERARLGGQPWSGSNEDRGSRRAHGHGGGGRSSHKLQPGQTLDVNAATAAELVALPGVGPGLARRIVEYREQNGPFQTVDDLQNVSGIGPSKFEKMQPYVRL